MASPSTLRIVAALATVYVVWGSTYLAIRFGVETIPPWTLTALRWLSAGALLAVWVAAKRVRLPTRSEWRGGTEMGVLLVIGGNGLVTWAEQVVPSGITALIVATIPMWFALFAWAAPGGSRPTWRVTLGLAIGFTGAVMLARPWEAFGGDTAYALSAGVILLAAISWAFGSIRSRRLTLHPDPVAATMTQMVTGGAVAVGLALVTGEPSRFDPAAVSQKSWFALVYLSLAGSVVAYSAYTWLLRNATPSVTSTYAYVNPVVAVALGAWLAAEALTWATVAAAALVVVAVALIVTVKTPPSGPSSRPRPRRKTPAS